MLDCDRLDFEEPYDIDDYMVFHELSNNHLFLDAWNQLKVFTEIQTNIIPHSYSISWNLDYTHKIADFNFVCISTPSTSTNHEYFRDIALRRWRYKNPAYKFVLTQYSYKTEGPNDFYVLPRKLHWLHYIITDTPELFIDKIGALPRF